MDTEAINNMDKVIIDHIVRRDQRYRVMAEESMTKQYCTIIQYENHDIAIAMSPFRADPVLPWLGLFKYLKQCHCPGWRYLNIYISVTALAGGSLLIQTICQRILPRRIAFY